MSIKSKINLKAIPGKGRENKDKEVILILGGELLVENSSQVRDFLLKNLKAFDKFTLRLSDVVAVDLSILQLLQRFIWDAESQKKATMVEFNLSPDIETFLAKTGFRPLLSLSTNK